MFCRHRQADDSSLYLVQIRLHNMSHNPSSHLLLFITRNKKFLFLSLSIPRNFIFFLTTNQPTFPHHIFSILPINQSTFPHLTFCKLSSLTTLQRSTRDGNVAATEPSIYIAYHPTRDDNMAATKSSIHIAYHSTEDGGMAVTRSSIHIAHHFHSFV